MELVMRRMVFALGLLCAAVLLVGVFFTPAQVVGQGESWTRFLMDRQAYNARPIAPLADPTFGVLILVLVGLWARSVWSGKQEGDQPSWRARKSDPQPGGADVLAQLLGQRREIEPLVNLPQMDAEAGGDHVERWRPEPSPPTASEPTASPSSASPSTAPDPTTTL